MLENKPGIKACVFDLDGTLLYTLPAIAKAGNAVLEMFGHPAQPVADYAYYCGDGSSALVRRIFDKVGDGDEEHYRIGCKKNREALQADPNYGVRSYEGIPEAVRELKKRGIRLAVCSNKPHPAAVDTIRHFFGEELFDCVQGQEEGLPLKPDAAMPKRVLEALGCDPESSLYFGDTATDMQTAKNAGIRAVGVLWGYRDRAELIRGGADVLIREPCEILKLLDII